MSLDLQSSNHNQEGILFAFYNDEKLILLFSVQIMSYLGASDIIYNDVINSFIAEILRFKEGSKRAQHVSNTCWIRFEHSLNTL